MFSGPRQAGTGHFGPYAVTLMTDCEKGYSSGLPVKYAHVLIVHAEEGDPLYMVTAEYPADVEPSGESTLALGIFDESGHQILGRSTDWKDLKLFAKEAERLVRARFLRSE